MQLDAYLEQHSASLAPPDLDSYLNGDGTIGNLNISPSRPRPHVTASSLVVRGSSASAIPRRPSHRLSIAASTLPTSSRHFAPGASTSSSAWRDTMPLTLTKPSTSAVLTRNPRTALAPGSRHALHALSTHTRTHVQTWRNPSWSSPLAEGWDELAALKLKVNQSATLTLDRSRHPYPYTSDPRRLSAGLTGRPLPTSSILSGFPTVTGSTHCLRPASAPRPSYLGFASASATRPFRYLNPHSMPDRTLARSQRLLPLTPPSSPPPTTHRMHHPAATARHHSPLSNIPPPTTTTSPYHTIASSSTAAAPSANPANTPFPFTLSPSPSTRPHSQPTHLTVPTASHTYPSTTRLTSPYVLPPRPQAATSTSTRRPFTTTQHIPTATTSSALSTIAATTTASALPTTTAASARPTTSDSHPQQPNLSPTRRHQPLPPRHDPSHTDLPLSRLLHNLRAPDLPPLPPFRIHPDRPPTDPNLTSPHPSTPHPYPSYPSTPRQHGILPTAHQPPSTTPSHGTPTNPSPTCSPSPIPHPTSHPPSASAAPVPDPSAHHHHHDQLHHPSTGPRLSSPTDLEALQKLLRLSPLEAPTVPLAASPPPASNLPP